jgi:tetratricopeptide (TPR) repeat protein
MGEEKNGASQLREVHHLLTQGKSHEAQLLSSRIAEEKPAPFEELSYLDAWYALTQDHWEQVTEQVREFPVLQHVKERESLLTNGSVRRRRPICLLMLGEMAYQLGYPEEASEHIRHCLALLSERRMNIPEVRALAHWSLGRIALEMHQTAQALTQYTTAKNLCSDDETQRPLLIVILTGLCETYIQLEQYEQALMTGKQALRLLQLQENACQEKILLLLSRVCLSLGDNASALSYAQDAWQTAKQTNDPTHLAKILLVLADVQYNEHQTQEARASCQQVLALLLADQEPALRGKAFFLLGKIAEAEWRSQQTQDELVNQALDWYKQAHELFESLHDASALANVAQHLAQLLEDRGQPEQALRYWKNAYMLAGQRG